MSIIYLVTRRIWEDHYAGHDVDAQRGVPVAWCADQATADRLCLRLETQARESIASPFLIAEDLWHLTYLEEDTFIEAIQRLGLTPPEARTFHGYQIRDWVTWYDERVDTLTPWQRDGLWNLLPGIRFYQVLVTELDDTDRADTEFPAGG